MIDFNSVHGVMRRISDIEYKIGMKRPNGGGAVGFQETLDEEMKKASAKQETKKTESASKSEKTPATAPESAVKSEAGATPADDSPWDPSNYMDVIVSAAKKYGVDPKLVSAVAEVESGFDQDARSSAGAIGIMQLMPGTAEYLGVNPYDAAENIEGGVKYLKELLDDFGGDERKAVAAYNAGPAAVRRYGGSPPYAETKAYVNSVLDLYR